VAIWQGVLPAIHNRVWYCVGNRYIVDSHFCAMQDAYMPKDASKLGHRGIGFVTFASPDAVEMVRTVLESLPAMVLHSRGSFWANPSIW